MCHISSAYILFSKKHKKHIKVRQIASICLCIPIPIRKTSFSLKIKIFISRRVPNTHISPMKKVMYLHGIFYILLTLLPRCSSYV